MTTTPSQAIPDAPILAGLFPEEIAEAVGVPKYRGTQVFRWIHQKKTFDVDAMSDLPKDFRTRVAQSFRPLGLEVLREQVSERTGTRKTLTRMHDGEQIESVLIRDKDRVTLCVSSQAGCPLKCSFCATGAAGYRRNLSAGEIVEQVLHLLENEDIPGVVNRGLREMRESGEWFEVVARHLAAYSESTQ